VVADRVAEVVEGCIHRSELSTEVRDGGGALLHRAKLGREKQRA
jgi:hypothetical protein